MLWWVARSFEVGAWTRVQTYVVGDRYRILPPSWIPTERDGEYCKLVGFVTVDDETGAPLCWAHVVDGWFYFEGDQTYMRLPLVCAVRAAKGQRVALIGSASV